MHTRYIGDWSSGRVLFRSNFNTSASMANGTLSGGNLSGVGTFTVNGTLTWTAGSMTGAGRSEERRGGKERRARGRRKREKKKTDKHTDANHCTDSSREKRR